MAKIIRIRMEEKWGKNSETSFDNKKEGRKESVSTKGDEIIVTRSMTFRRNYTDRSTY